MTFQPVELTPEQKQGVEVARIGFMASSPFLCHYFYSEMKDVYTNQVPTAATDGRHIFINPEYMMARKPAERVFIYAHEVYHVIMRHNQRMRHYRSEGQVRTTDYNQQTFNKAADYVINADLIEQGVGMCNPDWLYDQRFTGADLAEDVYEKIWTKQEQDGAKQPGMTAGQGGKAKQGKGDAQAQANGGGFDELLEPSVDPVTGKEDIPDEAEFKEAVARAAGAAKAIGNLPGSFKRIVEEILEPQVDWREHVRMLITGRVGHARETWDRPDRRRLSLSRGRVEQLVMMPGRKGHGCNEVVVGVDTSGSIGDRELAAFFAEVGGVLNDVRPKKVILMACDTRVTQVDEANSLDELHVIRSKGLKGGGGTSFEPVFDKVKELRLQPAALIYLTDMLGSFPDEAPPYPTIWCSTSKGHKGPFGDTVEIKLGD
jgi:predicted metal-dependent peptidase